MNVLHVLPRNSRYSRHGATSQDLFVAEVVRASRFAETTFVAGEGGQVAPLSPNVIDLYPARARKRVLQIVEVVQAYSPDVVVMHQHLPTAAAVARKISQPLVLMRHNYVSVPTTSRNPFSWLRRKRKLRQLQVLSGIAMVSQSVRDDFQANWPNLQIPLEIITNGVDFLRDEPVRERISEILCVGRADPQKGLLEAAQATARVLARRQEWSATFIVSEGEVHPDNVRAIRNVARPHEDRFDIRYNLPHDVVRAYTERSAIAVVPSIWREPFGRTALEAHAGGAAVITSGTGGLAEISGSHALYLEEVTSAAIEAALDHLIDDDRLRADLASAGWWRARSMFDIRIVTDRLDRFLQHVALGEKASLRTGTTGTVGVDT